MEISELIKSFNQRQPTHVSARNEISKILQNVEAYKLYADSMSALDVQGVSVSAFEMGNSIDLALEQLLKITDVQKLSLLPSSLRFTNVQIVDENISKVVQIFWDKFGIPLSCNAYYTPDHESQCFTYHSDPQESIIYQIMGGKCWHFPKKDSAFYADKHIGLIHGQEIERHPENFEIFKIDMNTGDTLMIPYGYSHKAINVKNEPSVHLTFSHEDLNLNQFNEEFFSSLVDIDNFEENYFKPFSMEQIEKIPNFLAEKDNLEQLLEQKIKHKNEIMIKKGRPY